MEKTPFRFNMNQYAMEAFLYTSDFGEEAYLFNSSSSSDSEDDDYCTCQEETELETQAVVKKPKLEGFVEIEVPLLNEHDFQNSFRVTRATYEKVLEMLYNSFNSDHKGGREKITPEKATYILLWYLGNQETFKQMADRFKNTMSSIHCVLKTATKTLSSKLHEHILWPSYVEYPNISQIFQNICTIAGCIGVLGVSYIKIPKPKEDGENYLCNGNFSSLAFQGVITVNGKFLDIFIGEGSNDVEQLLQKSYFLKEAENGLLGDYFLVGFNNYSNRKWLIQPFKDSNFLSTKHIIFNDCLSAATNLFTESLGSLKGRFQRLQNFENKDINLVTRCIESACMIHNLAIDCEDYNDEFVIKDTGILDSTALELDATEEINDNEARNRVLENLFLTENELTKIDDIN